MSDLISDLQRLKKHTSGHPDDEHVARALAQLGQARETALGENGEEDKKN